MQWIVANLREELAELDAFVSRLSDDDFSKVTPFYNWRVSDEVLHLHWVDWLGMLSLTDPDRFALEGARMAKARSDPDHHMAPYTEKLFDMPDRPRIMAMWREGYEAMCDHFEALDPKSRMTWFGPPMGVRSFATARQMEVWAHGQDIYDTFGRRRRNSARLRNIADIGVRTYGWSFVVRKEPAPLGPPPYVALFGPDGEAWDWNDPGSSDSVHGAAEDFCLVVTQRRNVADTSLVARGAGAERWLQIAQCFAGEAAIGPAPGKRVTRSG
jgi:uncharacterized protein (TIGR03084 family)